jgi:hypothetical protein
MLTIEYAKDPKYNDNTGNSIDLIVKFYEFDREVPFAATSYDDMDYGRELHARAQAGEFGPVAPYVPPIPTAEDNKQTAVSLLKATDWAASEDIANPQVANPYLINQSEFLAYRSAVREIAINPVAGNIEWPVKPTEQWSS